MASNHITIKVHVPSTREKSFFFLAGVIMSVPMAVFFEAYLDSALSGLSTIVATIISVALIAPFVEEFSKAFPLFYRHGETQRSIVILAVCVGLGFGIVEFLEYVFLLHVPVIDRIPGLFFHPASTAITAYGIATKKTTRYYLLAVGLHFANNFSAIISPVPISTIIVAITVVIAYRLYTKTQETIIPDDYAEVTEVEPA
ncbi:MAG TPA: PrsW family glutamic-type intramembrane protease [Candidatus Limnocylindrales bacterium]|nr:PrsW family glutamic-type intramembrane protease [Candidatus Limnocylindrales bacterium]